MSKESASTLDLQCYLPMVPQLPLPDHRLHYLVAASCLSLSVLRFLLGPHPLEVAKLAGTSLEPGWASSAAGS